MAFYDSGVTYDSGLKYDEAVPITTRTRMAKIKLNLKDKSDSELVTFTQQHITALTGNATFATPLPATTAFQTTFAAFQTALGACVNAQQAAKQATTQKENARIALEAALNQRGNYVELTAAGDVAKIQSAGFDVKGSGAPAGVPGTVMNLFITSGDNAGELDLQWDPLTGAKTYEVQLSPDPVTNASWNGHQSVTKSRTAVTGLTTGVRMWARVRAVAAAGPGAWSDVATKIVP
jgi:hypothetical protein